MDIDAMPAGREMDALVAEKVMGCKVTRGYFDGAGNLLAGTKDEPYCGCDDDAHYSDSRGEVDRFPNLPDYSTSIEAAWEVLEHVNTARGFCGFTIKRFSEGDGWDVQIGESTALPSYTLHYHECWQREGDIGPHMKDAAPLAICRAALKAVL